MGITQAGLTIDQVTKLVIELNPDSEQLLKRELERIQFDVNEMRTLAGRLIRHYESNGDTLKKSLTKTIKLLRNYIGVNQNKVFECAIKEILSDGVNYPLTDAEEGLVLQKLETES